MLRHIIRYHGIKNFVISSQSDLSVTYNFPGGHVAAKALMTFPCNILFDVLKHKERTCMTVLYLN